MNVLKEHTGISTLIGTPKEVRVSLGKSHADQVLVVTLENLNINFRQTFVDNLSTVAASMYELLQERYERASLEHLAEAMVPRTPATPRLLKEAGMLVKARKAVLESGDWLTAAQLAELAGLSTNNPSAQPNKWKKSGHIFAINHNSVDYFPGYGLDQDASFRPLKAMAKVIEVFNGHKDAWGMAFWFLSVNSFLGGKRPQDLIAITPQKVIDAAIDEVQEVAHG